MALKQKKIFLVIDGNALVHRAWHALPPLSTKSGQVISGAYGFTMILLGAIKEFAPAYVAVTFDLKGPTFRHEEYAAYKATREKKPDELYAQIPLIERILAAMAIPVYTREGYEADDVIGTLTRLAVEQDAEVRPVIVTGDLDTLQLVDRRTTVFTLRKGMTDTVHYDAPAVRERYGLDPEQLVDYKALRGDPSDNIPGVKGIGEKTAAELIAVFGSIEKLYSSLKQNDRRAAALKPSVREKLAAHEADALLAKRLCLIKRDVPLKFALIESRYRPVTREQVAPIFEEFQFLKLLERLPSAKVSDGEVEMRRGGGIGAVDGAGTPTLFDQPSSEAEVAPELIADPAQLKKILVDLKTVKRIAFRTLTKIDDPVSPEPFALGLHDGEKTHLIAHELLKTSFKYLSDIFSPHLLICHDAKRETQLLRTYGLRLGPNVFDLMLASYLLYAGERRHTLPAILAFHRNVPDAEKPLNEAGQLQRLANELPHLLAVAADLGNQLETLKLKRLYDDIELPLAPVLAEMELSGIAVDAGHFQKLSRELGRKIGTLEKTIYDLAGREFNLNSPTQLKTILFETLAIPVAGVKKTAKGGGLSTAASELEKLRESHPVIPKILAYRELAKLKSTYVDALPELIHPQTGRIHAAFNQTVAATGRLSSSNPNLQNIPTPETDYGKAVRDGFVAPRGRVLFAADYSQFELRIAAHIAEERSMIEAFRQGEDIHYRTAVQMFGEAQAKERRRLAKTINFGILYGMGPQRLAESAGVSFNDARAYIEQYFSVHAGIAAYIERTKEKIRRDGYVETLFGRRRFFRNYDLLGKREQAEAERQAINMPIQGTQADLIKLAMIRIDQELRRRFGEPQAAPCRLILQVHDELVFELEERLLEELAPALEAIMVGVNILQVPLAVNLSTGRSWGSMTPRKS